MASEAARGHTASADRIHRKNAPLALAVSAFLAITAVLPLTESANRLGVLLTAASVFAVTVIWYLAVPPTALGDRRVVVFAVLVQPCAVVLLAFTGGVSSPYFAYTLLPVLITVYAPRARHTFVVAVATAISLGVVAAISPSDEPAAIVASRLGNRLLEIAAFVIFTAFVGRGLRTARQALATRATELANERSRAMRLAMSDPLTGLYNRRYSDDVLRRLIAEAIRGRSFSVVAIDLDGLKRLNDSRGHAAGDEVLARLGGILRRELRGGDVAVRTGGDEFVVLLPSTGADEAARVAERVRSAVRDADWSAFGGGVSVSVGWAEWRTGMDAEDVIRAADSRLYEAKRARTT